MKIAFVTDIHATEKYLDGEQGHAKLMEKMVEQILEREPDLVLVGGDLTGQTVPHRATPRERNVIVQACVDLVEVCPVAIARGNHDAFGDFYFLNHVRGKYQVTYSQEPEFLEFVTPAGRIGVMVFPWRDRAVYPVEGTYAEHVRLEYLRELEASRKNMNALRADGGLLLMLGHLAVMGGVIREGQPTVPTHDPVMDLFELTKTNTFAAAMIGHYHQYQALTAACPAVYGGSTFVSQYGELVPKGWTLFDSDGKAFEHVELPQPAKIRIDLDTTKKRVNCAPQGVLPIKTNCAVDRVMYDFLGEKQNAHVKIVARYSEADRVEGDALHRQLQADLDGLVLGIDLDIRIDRAERVREGALEVSQAKTLTEKLANFAAFTDNAPEDEVIGRSLELLNEMDLAE